LTPPPRTNQACLRDALGVVFPKRLILPLARRDGWAVLEETRHHDEVVTTTKHAVKVDDTGFVEIVRGHDYYLENQVRAEFRRQTELLKPSQVTTALVAVLSRLKVTRLRPTGGIYWLPQEVLPAWQAVSEVVERASVGGRNSIYRITHALDAEAIRAVRDALLAQVNDECEVLIKEVDSGELGEAALKNRALSAESLQRKVSEYERILGERLMDAADIAEKARLAATAARIVATGAA